MGRAHPAIEITYLPTLCTGTKLPKQYGACQEQGGQLKRPIFLLDELLQLRYNLPAAERSLVLPYPVSGWVEELSEVHSRPPQPLKLGVARLFYDGQSGVVQQAGHAALDRRIGVRIPAPELLSW